MFMDRDMSPSHNHRPIALPLKLSGYLLLLILVAACGARNRPPTDPNLPRQVSGKFLWQNNTENMKKIKLGMSREKVVDTMGRFRVRQHNGYVDNPVRTDVLSKDGDNYLILYYELRRWGSPTPIILKNNAVIGWGWETLRIAFPPPTGAYEAR
jgi:hypothetical protein